ncbi:MAG: dinitrogenase iron-molybdenum cofactor biosynthesis protein [Phycisphaerae bacterium]|nr:dinitrogenase iron-molybdenum cofactor biosynthesis protein [Phycisphaerae bacterium]
MRQIVAIPTMNAEGLDSRSSFHFGGCEFFTFVTIQDGKAGEVESMPNPGHGPEGCIGPVNLIHDHGADSLIALGIGGGPLLALQQMAIDVYRGVEGTVAENIAAYLAGKLRKVSEMTCTGGHVGQ